MTDEPIEGPVVVWLKRPSVYLRALRSTDESTYEGATCHTLADILETSVLRALEPMTDGGDVK